MSIPSNATYDALQTASQQAQQLYSQHAQNQNAAKVRYGLMAARINSDFEYKLTKPIRLPSGRLVKVGTKIYLGVKDITLEPEAAPYAKWMCMHAGCAHKRFVTKQELVNEHEVHAKLVQAQEVHCYVAVTEEPAIEAVPAKVAKDGTVVTPAVDARPAMVMLLSNEE